MGDFPFRSIFLNLNWLWYTHKTAITARYLWWMTLISAHKRQGQEDQQFKTVRSYIKSNYLCPEIINKSVKFITVSHMESYVFEVIKNYDVWWLEKFTFPFLDAKGSKDNFPKCVLKAIKRSGRFYSPCSTTVLSKNISV